MDYVMELASYSDSEILAIIEPLMDNMLAGSTEIDHAKHVRDFTHRLKVIVTEDNLSRQCDDYQKRLGYFKKREIVSIFRRSHSIAAVWRLWYTKSDDEYVCEAMFVERDGKLLIEHCMIF